MKTLKAMSAAFVLALSLSIPAYSDTAPGDGHSPGRCVPDPGTIGTPAENTDSTGEASASDVDIRSLNLANFLLALGFDLLR